MSKFEMLASGTVIYVVISAVIFWLIMRAKPLTAEELIAAAQDDDEVPPATLVSLYRPVMREEAPPATLVRAMDVNSLRIEMARTRLAALRGNATLPPPHVWDRAGGHPSTAPVMEAPRSGEGSPASVDMLPEIINAMDRILRINPNDCELLILKCSDTRMWYRDMIGKRVPYVRALASEDCFLSREPSGYTNIVMMQDATLMPKVRS